MSLKLKLIYIYFGGDLSQKLPGVHKKIISKINNLNTDYSICHGISIQQDFNSLDTFENLFFIKPQLRSKLKYFNSIRENSIRFFELEEYLKNHTEFDYLIFRYPLASKPLLEFCKKHKGKVLIEFNTLEVPELTLSLKNLISGTKFSFKPGYFINIFENGILPIIREYYYKSRILKEIKFAIAVSNEILDSLKKTCHSCNGFVLSNSIDTRNYFPRTQIIEAKTVLKLFMLVGFNANWHGVERLIKSAFNYKGNRKIEVYIFGETHELLKLSTKKLQNIEFIFCHTQSKEELDSHLHDKHIGIGTLSAHLKSLFEASPLKVREYIARGFPIIIGYEDTDLSCTHQIDKMIYKVKNDNSLIDFQSVVDWYDSLNKIENWPAKIQKFAAQKLDTSMKMNFLLSKLLK
jgi:hypothetical protein